jgi:peptidyl-tRNA hydrolase, PTH1 family
MITIFYGLGNEGKDFKNTKHNIGQLVIEQLISTNKLDIKKTKTKSSSQYLAKLNENTNLIFSSGYMNESGLPIAEYINYYKIEPKQIRLIIIQDDSDQLIGNYKLCLGGKSAGHKGIDSVYNHLKSFGINSTEIYRIKIGIRPPQNTQKSLTFVLSPISAGEDEIIKEITKKINVNHNLIGENMDKFTTIFNTKTN